MGLKTNRLAGRVVGIGHRRDSMNMAIEKGAVDDVTTDIAVGVSDADLVIIATPVSMIPQKMEQVAPHMKEGALLTDVGSAKGFIMQEYRKALNDLGCGDKPPFTFIGGHPIAGSENRGIEYAQ